MRDSMTLLAGAACVSYNRHADEPFVDFALCDKWQRRGALFLASHQGKETVNGIHGRHAYSVLQVSCRAQSSAAAFDTAERRTHPPADPRAMTCVA